MSYSEIKAMNYLIFVLELISFMLTILWWCSAGAQHLDKHNYIDFNSSSLPVDSNKAILISTKSHIYVEINSFDQRFRIIAKVLEPEKQIQIYSGKVYLKHDSYVIGYVKTNTFVGLIKVDGQAYSLETVTKSDPNYTEHKNKILMYREDSVPFAGVYDTVVRPKFAKRQKIRKKKKSKYRLRAQHNKKLPKNKVCALDLYADYHFVKQFGAHDAIAEILITVRESNVILSRIDFDGDGQPDNIGVVDQKITVTEFKNDNLNLINITDGQQLLRKFQKRLTDSCLQVLFTHQELKFLNKGITGLANLGGVCHKRAKIGGIIQSPNSLLVSSVSNNRLVNRVQRIIDLTHEIGHTFGAEHDNEVFEGNTICNPSAANGGAFIMSTIHEDTAYQSKRVMRRVLSDSERNQCFTKRPDPKCGDLEVNADEECDAGSHLISGFADPCCEPTGSERQCRIKSGVECHPREGSCCDVKTCRFLHWKTFPAKCRIDCWEPAMCLGKSAKCPVNRQQPSGSICWNCSSDVCICDKSGVCRDKHFRFDTTPQYVWPTRPKNAIHKFRDFIFIILGAVILFALIFFLWFYGLFDYIWDFFQRILFNYRRNRVRNRLLGEPLDNITESDTETESEHEHRH